MWAMARPVRKVAVPAGGASKGEATRASILDTAVRIASQLGLDGLTIGSLAEATGMSKSGLFAHFGSRDELQLAVLQHAGQRFGDAVGYPSFRVERGLPRLKAMFNNWLDWPGASGLPGGCVLLSAAYEFDDRPGPIRDAVVAQQREGVLMLEKAARIAIEEGHFLPVVDPKQVAFEMFGILLVYHHHRRLLDDAAARKRALTAFDGLLARCVARARSHTPSTSR